MPVYRAVILREPNGSSSPRLVRVEADDEMTVKDRLTESGARVLWVDAEAVVAPHVSGPILSAPESGESLPPVDEWTNRMSEPGIGELANALLRQAIHRATTDIHLVPTPADTSIQFRIDGLLHEEMSLPVTVSRPLTARWKIMAGLDPFDEKRPQSGRFPFRAENRDFDIRLSTLSVLQGESVVARLIDPSLHRILTLDDVGLGDDETAQRLLRRSHGLVAFAGPTGSGKTTVFFAALNSFDRERLNVVLVVDDTPYRLDGVNHIVVPKITAEVINDVAGLDPDVIGIGEIIDRESARAAGDARENGHLVLTVVTAADAADAIERLHGLGLDSRQLAGVISSRLVRKICPHCRRDFEPPVSSLREIGIVREEIAGARWFHGAGCEGCRYTGYRGRAALFETVEVTPGIAAMVTAGATGESLRSVVSEAAGRTFRADAKRRVLDGTTTAEEALRVIRP